MRRTVSKRIVIAVTAAVSAAAVTLLGGALRDSQGAAPARAAVPGTLGAQPASGTDAEVRRLQDVLRRQPDDVHSLAALGLAYEQRMRETADPTYLTKADGVLHRALRLGPRSAEAVIGLGSLALSRHQFGRALVLGRRAQRLAPGAGLPYGIVGDAQIELGRYAAAFRSFDTMSSVEPGPSAYARVAYGRELLGNRGGAIAAMRLALDGSEGRAEPAAWARVEMGKLFFGSGRIGAAEREYVGALRELPGYVYALDALARAQAARGHYRRAVALSQRAVETVPLPQFVTTLADIYLAKGDGARAREQFALVGVVERLLRANGVRADMEIAQFYVDHGLRLRHALVLARRAHAERPSIAGDDVLAWALVRNGRCGEAVRWSRHSLRLGTHDATMYFHRGMAEHCAGHRTEAQRWFRRALALNAHFSLLWSPVARRLA
jgi:tetratricopeptide (TPR) repeat protein